MIKQLPPKQGTCDKHGVYLRKNVFGKVWSRCPKCTTESNKAEAEAEWEGRLAKAGIERRFRHSTFGSYRADTEAKRAALMDAKGYADAYPSFRHEWRVLLLCGSNGCGKTHLASSIVMRVIKKHNAGVLMIKCAQIGAAVRDTFNDRQTEAAALARYQQVGLLIIDEIEEGMSDFEKRQVFKVINYRYEQQLPIAIVANLNREALEQAVGERAYDRLTENSTYVPFGWASHRGK